MAAETPGSYAERFYFGSRPVQLDMWVTARLRVAPEKGYGLWHHPATVSVRALARAQTVYDGLAITLGPEYQIALPTIMGKVTHVPNPNKQGNPQSSDFIHIQRYNQDGTPGITALVSTRPFFNPRLGAECRYDLFEEADPTSPPDELCNF